MKTIIIAFTLKAILRLLTRYVLTSALKMY